MLLTLAQNLAKVAVCIQRTGTIQRNDAALGSRVKPVLETFSATHFVPSVLSVGHMSKRVRYPYDVLFAFPPIKFASERSVQFSTSHESVHIALQYIGAASWGNRFRLLTYGSLPRN